MRPKKPTGLQLVVAYKVIKAVLQALLAAGLLVVVCTGHTTRLLYFAELLRRNFAGEWSVRLADLLVTATTPRHLVVIVVALALDAVASVFEGFALVRGWWWAPWLVVIATSSLLPFELVALFRHVRLGRLLILAVNVAIVLYLGRRALREHERRKEQQATADS